MSATTNAAGVPDGWLIDGSLLYRLNDIGVNCDEINVTMADGSRKDGPRAKRAQEILAAITLHADRITALEAKCDLLAASLKQADAVKGQLVAALSGMLEYAGLIEERCDSVATNRARAALAAAGEQS